MTTVAYRDGVLAADSCETIEGGEDAGTYKTTCEKLFRVGPFVVALQGESSPGMVWLEWLRSEYREYPRSFEDTLAEAAGGREVDEQARAYVKKHYDASVQIWARKPLPCTPENLVERFLANDADFTAVVLAPGNKLYEYDAWGIPCHVTAEYYAVGSGAKVALGAMSQGASAFAAVTSACIHDPYTNFPVKEMRLDNAP